MCVCEGVLDRGIDGNGRFTYSPNAAAQDCVGAIWYLRSVAMEM